MHYRFVCVAGTFDGLHVGHETLLTRAFHEGKRVLIGLTSDMFVSQWKKTKRMEIAPYKDRKHALIRWLKAHDWLDRATIVLIDNPYGPAVSDAELDALIVSEESYTRGADINAQRAALLVPALTLIIVPMVRAEDNEPISASRVREGEIDRTGKLTMPNSLRSELVQPLGRVLAKEEIPKSFIRHSGDIIISVGDLTTKTLLEAGITPRLMIIDNMVNRKPFAGLKQIMKEKNFYKKKVKSGPGFIAQEAVDLLHDWAKTPTETRVIEVDGEEDLLVLPAIIASPIDAVLYYGQPGMGLVEVVVDTQSKTRAGVIIGQFT